MKIRLNYHVPSSFGTIIADIDDVSVLDDSATVSRWIEAELLNADTEVEYEWSEVVEGAQGSV